MSQVLELDLGREVERRLEAQAGALQGLLALAQQMLELAAAPQLEASRLAELVREDEKFFGRLKQLEEGLLPLRRRWVAENADHERRRNVEEAARRVQELIGQLAGVHKQLQARLEAARGEVAAELRRLPASPRRAKAKGRAGKLL
jgi:hypothetical protein